MTLTALSRALRADGSSLLGQKEIEARRLARSGESAAGVGGAAAGGGSHNDADDIDGDSSQELDG